MAAVRPLGAGITKVLFDWMNFLKLKLLTFVTGILTARGGTTV